MIIEFRFSSKFKKQYEKYLQNRKIKEDFEDRREECVTQLQYWNLDPKRKNHKLQGKFQWMQELHLFPDILVVYYIEDNVCYFAQIGSHSDLFG